VDPAAYLVAKTLHVGCAALSIGGFAARGALMLAESPLLAAKPVRILPHIVDTVLLASAVWLAWGLGQGPFAHGWIFAKIAGLVAYIALGVIALRRGRTKRVRSAAFVAALATAGYIVAVAVTRSALGPLAWLPEGFR
jgi:uncharacterized membrane protein SirB2